MCVKFEGKMMKEGKYWAVWVSALDIHSQGTSKKNALAMIKEAVELMIDRKGFSVSVTSLANNHFVLRTKRSEHDRYLLAFMLKNQRAKYGLSISQVAGRLGISKNGYAQYEQARALPSIAKIEEFIHVMSERVHVVLDVLDGGMAV